ncbi:hypothetical protein Tco_1352259 [Tanacetum coccineum]
MLALQAEEGEGSGNPSEPQPPHSTAQPTHKEPIPNIESVPIPNVLDEAVHQEKGDSVERAATTATSLEAMQDSSNIAKTRSMATPTELISQETGSDGIDGFIYKLSDRVLALETDLRQTKKVYGTAYTKFIMKVKKLEKTVKTSQARRRANIVVSVDDIASEDSSKQGRMIEEIDQDVGVTLVTLTKVTRVHTYSRRRRAVSTGSGGVSTPGMIQQVNIIIPSSSATKDKGKAIMTKSEPEQTTTKLKRRQERVGYEGFTEIEWEDIRASVEANEELTQKLQAEERDKYSEVDQARMLVDMINQRKSYFVAQKAIANTFTSIKTEDKERESELAAGSSKRPRAEYDEEHDEESVKKQKLEENNAEKEELRACLDIVLGDEIAMNFESLATKYPIIDWKTHILTENMMYYQIIRADGSSKNYKIFSEMLNDFDKHDVVDLHRLVQERYETTNPEGYDLLLWGDLKTLFEPCEEDEV